MARKTAGLERGELRSAFLPREGKTELIGIEIESAAVDPHTGRSIPYEGPRGLRALLEAIMDEAGGTPKFDASCLTGIVRDDGSQVTLEHGGAVEYSSAPVHDLVGLVDTTRMVLARLSELADRFGIALLSGGSLPFETIDDVNWVPMSRGRLMRDHFARLGDPGALGPSVMALTLSTQTTLDYLSEEDLSQKVRMLTVVTPIVAALFVNSPLAAGRRTGALSRRSQYWFQCDPSRCGMPPYSFSDAIRIDDIIDWALSLPMIWRERGAAHYVAMPSYSFGRLMKRGFDDGTKPTMHDWRSHLTQTWPYVRVRDTIELRVTDGPAFPDFMSVPALWTGMAYHEPSRLAALELLGGRALGEYQRAMRDIAVAGLEARLGGHRVGDLANELVRLAREGLCARVTAGLERKEALTYLAPVEEVIASGKTFAQRLLDRWDGDLWHRPDRYVDAYRITPTR